MLTAVASLLAIFAARAQENNEKQANPVVVIKTNHGEIEVELYADKAPVTVANFLKYVDAKFYDGTIFHRVMKDFMIQGGGMTADMEQKKTNDPIENEAANGLKNEVGTLAMARTNAPHSATAQFFINTKANDFLNYQGARNFSVGYAVFGKVTAGMEVVRKIEGVATGNHGMHQNVPREAVTIESIRRKAAN